MRPFNRKTKETIKSILKIIDLRIHNLQESIINYRKVRAYEEFEKVSLEDKIKSLIYKQVLQEKDISDLVNALEVLNEADKIKYRTERKVVIHRIPIFSELGDHLGAFISTLPLLTIALAASGFALTPIADSFCFRIFVDGKGVERINNSTFCKKYTDTKSFFTYYEPLEKVIKEQQKK